MRLILPQAQQPGFTSLNTMLPTFSPRSSRRRFRTKDTLRTRDVDE
jgi:hypothetical protein